MNRISAIITKTIKKKMFNKIFALYALIIVMSLLGLSVFLILGIQENAKQEQILYNKQIIQDIDNYIENKINITHKLLQYLYSNPQISSDVFYFLQNGSLSYNTYRLDKCAEGNNTKLPSIYTFINQCFFQDSDISSIALYSLNKKFMYVISKEGPRYYYIHENQLPNSLITLLESNIHKNFFTSTLYPDLNINAEDKHVYTTVNGIKDPSNMASIGCIVITFDVKGINKVFEKYEKKSKGNVIALTEKGDVIFDSSNRYYSQKYPYFNLLANTSKPQMLESKSYISINSSTSTKTIIAGIIPQNDIMLLIQPIRKTLLIFTFLLIVLSLVLTYTVISFFSKRVNSIMTAMDKLKEGDFSVRIPQIKSTDELGDIAINFNHMCLALNDYINKVYLAEIKQKNAQLIAFQNQINPHFLFNTLEVIRMRAIRDGAHDAGNMTYLLATLFRNNSKKDTIIKIREEIEQCKLYLQLFNLRYMNKLDFKLEIDNDILKYSIVKFSLQPIIENSLIHGMKYNSYNQIVLKCTEKKNDIYFVIKDNGCGMESNSLKKLKKELRHTGNYPSTGIGLTNVNERLKLIYGSKYGIKIHSELGNGTLILIKIPAKTKEELNRND